VFKKNELKKRLLTLKNNHGLYSSNLELIIGREFQASISPKDWGIKITVKKDWEPDKKITEYCNRNNIEKPLQELIGGLALHEITHWKKCPYDLETHNNIIEEVSKVLKNNDKYTKELSFSLANLFEDLIADNHSYWHDNANGIIINLLNVLNKKQRKPSVLKACISLSAYSLKTKDRRLLNKQIRLNEEEIKAVQKTIKNIGLTRTPLNIHKSRFKYLAGSFTEGLIDIINKDENLPVKGNLFQELIESEEGLNDSVKTSYEKGLGKPSYLSESEYLLRLYNSLSKELIVLAEAKKRDWSMPLVPYGSKPFDPEVDDPSKIRFNKGLKPNIKGELELQSPKHYLNINVPVKVSEGGMPDFIFLLDDSGSMSDGSSKGVPWGVDSKYHKALTGLFGALNYLQRKGYSKYINHELIMFSDNTRASGKKGFREVNVIKKMALKPEFGNTYLDMGVVSEALDCESSVVLILTDGEIFNWADIKNSFKQAIEPHYFSLIQLDRLYDSTKDIISWNKPVYQLNSVSDFDKLIIDLTKDSYNGGMNSV
jgi:hypothetical protein